METEAHIPLAEEELEDSWQQMGRHEVKEVVSAAAHKASRMVAIIYRRPIAGRFFYEVLGLQEEQGAHRWVFLLVPSSADERGLFNVEEQEEEEARGRNSRFSSSKKWEEGESGQEKGRDAEKGGVGEIINNESLPNQRGRGVKERCKSYGGIGTHYTPEGVVVGAAGPDRMGPTPFFSFTTFPPPADSNTLPPVKIRRRPSHPIGLTDALQLIFQDSSPSVRRGGVPSLLFPP